MRARRVDRLEDVLTRSIDRIESLAKKINQRFDYWMISKSVLITRARVGCGFVRVAVRVEGCVCVVYARGGAVGGVGGRGDGTISRRARDGTFARDD